MIIGVCTLEFHLPACRNLKQKRKFLKSFQSRIGNRFNVAVSEVEFHDLWQRSSIAVATVGVRREPVDRVLQKVLQEAERQVDAQLVAVDMEFL